MTAEMTENLRDGLVEGVSGGNYSCYGRQSGRGLGMSAGDGQGFGRHSDGQRSGADDSGLWVDNLGGVGGQQLEWADTRAAVVVPRRKVQSCSVPRYVLFVPGVEDDTAGKFRSVSS